MFGNTTDIQENAPISPGDPVWFSRQNKVSARNIFSIFFYKKPKILCEICIGMFILFKYRISTFKKLYIHIATMIVFLINE